MTISRQMNIVEPYAVAFSIEDLVRVRSWAEQRALRLTVVTDQVLDSAEFEELLVIAPPDRERRTLTIWRTHNSVFAQTPGGRPRAFATVADLLRSLRPAQLPQRAHWMRLLGFAG